MVEARQNWTVLDCNGFATLRGAVPFDWLDPLRATFERGVVPSDRWPVTRGHDWRHAMVDTDPLVQRLCRLPSLVAGIHHMLRQPFFLAQVEGREPCLGNAPQPLHRDGAGMAAGQVAAAMVWLDPYDAANGATRVVPGSHVGNDNDAAPATVLSGDAGDILLFAPDLLHGATSNSSGARRRSLLLTYAATSLRADFAATESLRGVRMGSSESFGQQ
jgi:Phytanoyl-CoA dioxygenase (PhyH)